eukprot:4014886-Pleurochrysis_carterae.AAC.1
MSQYLHLHALCGVEMWERLARINTCDNLAVASESSSRLQLSASERSVDSLELLKFAKFTSSIFANFSVPHEAPLVNFTRTNWSLGVSSTSQRLKGGSDAAELGLGSHTVAPGWSTGIASVVG